VLFHTITQIRLTSPGPESLQARRWHLIHLTQGSLDGACGPYSVVIVLLILGLLRHDDAASYGNWIDPASHKGKFWRLLEKGPAVLRDGTDLSELQKLAAHVGTQPLTVADVVKNTYVLEFLGLERRSGYRESDLEQAIINHL
jgi:hypothetical protein